MEELGGRDEDQPVGRRGDNEGGTPGLSGERGHVYRAGFGKAQSGVREGPADTDNSTRDTGETHAKSRRPVSVIFSTTARHHGSQN